MVDSTLPPVVDLDLYRGDRYELFLRISDYDWDETSQTWVFVDYLDLTPWTITGSIKDTVDSNTELGTFSISKSDQTTTDGKGGVLCVILPTTSKALAVGKYVYDVQGVLDANNVETFCRGSISVTGDVTA